MIRQYNTDLQRLKVSIRVYHDCSGAHTLSSCQFQSDNMPTALPPSTKKVAGVLHEPLRSQHTESTSDTSYRNRKTLFRDGKTGNVRCNQIFGIEIVCTVIFIRLKTVNYRIITSTAVQPNRNNSYHNPLLGEKG